MERITTRWSRTRPKGLGLRRAAAKKRMIRNEDREKYCMSERSGKESYKL